ncbi:TetR/AcrR family transcriptional regulator [Streptomyces sp. Je 1-4]|uniref:TetR/AcrR family transcriptional regulator n=1 Tax=Streptomyces TaxID=1883 RepID=UPI0021D85A42|nr:MULTISPECIES: TetR/AcrR family transcriptional regulator [unclassified Streptomyces]UYB39063.1 TetR/AcrR family transcriptional regulator [Streptomyces sp. Je 1-4]UZQ35063.1 TetR/AcrR family transcriptional regulator [Streptomyces sp. Je 1-4] [Streptomyces sp. Je 1-4 4N24]UZQ42481.1 TetR/AcrR family transcriptional regulator [Streptomyces sp. Je 1-4] [Streptomyces sp. Je 1-4 4N24_ara]
MTRHTEGRRARTRLQPDDRREHLIRAAVPLFAKKGIAGTSVLTVTKAAGVANGTFYHYFANKRELERAVAKVVIRDLTEQLAAIQQAHGYGERIALGAIGAMRAVADEPELGAIMLQYLEERHDALDSPLVQPDDDVRAGVDAGEFTVDCPIPFVASMLVATLAAGARDVINGADPDAVGEALAVTHLRILGVPREQSSAVTNSARGFWNRA